MIHLQKFIDRVQGTESRGLKDVSIPLSDAKSMAAELTRILLEMQSLREQALQQTQQEVVTVAMDGGTFK
jgi:hypothetical protein